MRYQEIVETQTSLQVIPIVRTFQVKIVPDFSGVSVYWEAKGTEEDIETERILQEKTGYLR